MSTCELIGSSPQFKAVLEDVRSVAAVDCAVLIRGETGTGKEIIARAIHHASARRQHRFVAVNCAAIPATLLESELFGYERGAFTGAVASRMGRFQAAHHGTIFLDEIGELPVELQPKLLRVIQEQEVERLGSSQPLRVDVRIVAATNQDLEQMLADRTFRLDLFYRLHVFPITIPPLRDRPDDIPLLIDHFLSESACRHGRATPSVPREFVAALVGSRKCASLGSRVSLGRTGLKALFREPLMLSAWPPLPLLRRLHGVRFSGRALPIRDVNRPTECDEARSLDRL